MIRIAKHLYINILTVALFVVCAVMGKLDILSVTYATMFVHELSHTIAAICIGLRVSHITFHPFGVNLKLRNKIVYSLADEIILYISGPLSNVAMALMAVALYSRFPYEEIRLFYISNIMLFIMNMLPVMPLDGGIILKKVLAHRIGNIQAARIMKITSALLAIAVMCLGVYIFYITGFNFSVLLFSLLMMGNIYTQKEKYDVDFVKELMFHTQKKNSNVKHMIMTEDTDYKSIIKKFSRKDYNVVYLTDESGKIKDIITESQIINTITNK